VAFTPKTVLKKEGGGKKEAASIRSIHEMRMKEEKAISTNSASFSPDL